MSEDEFDSIRISLIELYTQKSNAHIGYLIATALATIGASHSDIIKAFHFNVIILFLMSFSIMTYFLGRAILYSLLSNAIMYVIPYTPDEYEKNIKMNMKKINIKNIITLEKYTCYKELLLISRRIKGNMKNDQKLK